MTLSAYCCIICALALDDETWHNLSRARLQATMPDRLQRTSIQGTGMRAPSGLVAMRWVS
jgi:hypothetical protein